MKKILLAAAATICAFSTNADVLDVESVGLHIGSHHFPSDGYNNFNPGLYARNKDKQVVGFYYNSERRWSVYAGKDFHVFGPVNVRLGLVTGYKRFPIVPLGAVAVDLGDTGFKLSFIPPVDKAAGLVHLSYEKSL